MASIFDVLDAPPPSASTQRAMALFNAASRGNVDRVNALLSGGTIDVGYLMNGFNAFHIAAKKGHTAVVSALLSFKPSLIASRTSDGRSGSMLACFEGHQQVVLVLFSICGCDIFRDQDERGNNSLHYAAWGGHLQIINFILDIKSDDSGLHIFNPLAQNNEGLTALDMAAVGNHVEVIDSILAYMPLHDSTLPTVESQDSERCKSGYNSLHRAAQFGSLSAVRSLVSKGLAPSAVADSVAAIQTEDSASLVNKAASNGYTALHLACRHGYLDVVQYLLECGAEINAVNVNFLTPLHSACIGGYLSIVKKLLENGANPNALNESGATPLHMAAGNGRHEICHVLSQISTVTILVEDDEGNTPIDAALSSGYNQLASVLSGFAYVQQKSKRLAHLFHNLSWDTFA